MAKRGKPLSLPEFAASRARRVFADASAATRRRQQILWQLTESLCEMKSALFRPQAEAGDAGSFLLLVCGGGQAEQWVEQAASEGVTLRRFWPAYQESAGLASQKPD